MLHMGTERAIICSSMGSNGSMTLWATLVDSAIKFERVLNRYPRPTPILFHFALGTLWHLMVTSRTRCTNRQLGCLARPRISAPARSDNSQTPPERQQLPWASLTRATRLLRSCVTHSGGVAAENPQKL